MALLRVLFRAVLALVIILLMALVIYPLMAANIVFHILRSKSGLGILTNVLRNIFLNNPDTIRMSREMTKKPVDENSSTN